MGGTKKTRVKGLNRERVEFCGDRNHGGEGKGATEVIKFGGRAMTKESDRHLRTHERGAEEVKEGFKREEFGVSPGGKVNRVERDG